MRNRTEPAGRIGRAARLVRERRVAEHALVLALFLGVAALAAAPEGYFLAPPATLVPDR